MVGRADRCRREKHTTALLVPVSGPPPPVHPARLPQLETLPDVVRRRQTNRTSMVVRWKGARKARFGGTGHLQQPTEHCRPSRSIFSTWDQHQWLPAACARRNLSPLWSTGRRYLPLTLDSPLLKHLNGTGASTCAKVVACDMRSGTRSRMCVVTIDAPLSNPAPAKRSTVVTTHFEFAATSAGVRG